MPRAPSPAARRPARIGHTPLLALFAVAVTVGGLATGGSAAAAGTAPLPTRPAPSAVLALAGPADPVAAMTATDVGLRNALLARSAAAAREEARAIAEAALHAADAATASARAAGGAPAAGGTPAPDAAPAVDLRSAVVSLERALSPGLHGPASDGRLDEQVTQDIADAAADVFAAAEEVWVSTVDAGAMGEVRWSVPDGLAALEERVAATGALEVPELRPPSIADRRTPGPEELCEVPFSPSFLLRCDAADALAALNADHVAAFGTDLVVSSGFRSYADQVAVRAARGSLAAVPGTSNHELGVAVDLGGMGDVGDFSQPAYLWMKENAGRHGWFHPAAMEPGGSGPEEPWHWEFSG